MDQVLSQTLTARRIRILLTIVLTLTAASASRPAELPATDVMRTRCATLIGEPITPNAIRLPSGKAMVDSAQSIAATPAIAEHCKVLGHIDPLDPAAEPIQFQLNLPVAWNRKAL